MTARQLAGMSGLYLIVLAAAVYFTRATARRVLGAIAGGAAVGVLGIGAISLGNLAGWWRVPLQASPGFLALFYFGMAVSCAPIHLVTWRVARRFGRRGLACFVLLAAAIGPPRDYSFARKYPEWITFGPGATPVIAVVFTYALVIVAGHLTMRGVSGPARDDRLSRTERVETSREHPDRSAL